MTRLNQRRHPFTKCHWKRVGKYLFVSPHRMRSLLERIERQRLTRFGEIIASQKRRLTNRTQVPSHTVIGDVTTRRAGEYKSEES